MMHDWHLDARPLRLAEPLQAYFSALFWFKVECPPGRYIEDCLHPEWAAMRFAVGATPARAGLVPDPMRDCGPFSATGPTSRALRFALPRVRGLNLGLRAAGWARFMPVPACELADRIVGGDHPAFAIFRPLLEELRAAGDDHAALGARVNALLLDLDARFPPVPDRVLACQQALWDPHLCDVEEMAERVGVGRRTLERVCAQAFGFPPKRLLRRQRFLRSLQRFLSEPRSKWSAVLDEQYCDQPHFVHDFRSFMGMTPSEYAAMPHPLLDRILARRPGLRSVPAPGSISGSFRSAMAEAE